MCISAYHKHISLIQCYIRTAHQRLYGYNKEMNEKTTLYYDGYCNLCNTWMKIIKRADHKQSILFIPLQSEEGILVLKKIEKPDEKLDSLIYEKAGVYYINSDAVIYGLTDLGGVWKVTQILSWIPKSFRDYIYKTIARHRYTIFGRAESCNTAP